MSEREIVHSILEKIKDNIALYFDGVEKADPEERQENFEQLLFGKYSGCLPEEFLGDDLYSSIKKKFRVVFDAVRAVFAERHGVPEYRLPIHIDASYDGETFVDCLYEPEEPSGRTFVLYTMSEKAWNYKFESLADLEASIAEVYQRLEAELVFVHRLLEPLSAP